MEEKELPMRVSRKSNSSLNFDRILPYESDTHHYVLFKDLARFFSFIKNKKFRSTFHLCRKCLYMCYKDVQQFKDHIEICCITPPTAIRMLKASNNLHKFSNWSATRFPPLFIYFDFESILTSMASCPASSESASTRSIEIPCKFAIAVIEHDNSQPKISHSDSSVICMQNFV